MQNNTTGSLATSVPVGVVPSALRCPSWKIHTSAPNAAVNDNTFSTTAFTGKTTLALTRNRSPNGISGTTPTTPRSGGPDFVAAHEGAGGRTHRRYVGHAGQVAGVALERGGGQPSGVRYDDGD